MKKNKKNIRNIFLPSLLLFSFFLYMPSEAKPLSNKEKAADIKISNAMATYGETSIPIGWIDFCNRLKEECADFGKKNDLIIMNEFVWKTINAVNDVINARIEPVTDLEQNGLPEYWDYPTSLKGDCEDYALEKRRLLTQMGFPKRALLITVVREENGNGHAVLTVHTSKGDFILDNQEEKILPWFETPYTYVKRQSARAPSIWVSLKSGDALVPQNNIGTLSRLPSLSGK